ncbi:glycosyltransferase family 8 protein [Coleophoma cylindrospora]|uniref:Glycosyltransferase family 8 protein n=1 Tax=Coleophoma cylindrospora TaxID=1849047 RepID=A0A3D8S8Y0_9HELO|nr:glycosyltransferase family 8 protein [Coleophoma cylindrospora]
MTSSRAMASSIWQMLRTAAAVATLLLMVCSLRGLKSPSSRLVSFATTLPLPIHKYAYCVFLAPSNQTNGNTIETEDHYFIGTRMLIHSLLHDATTKTTSNIPFIVLVTPEITQEARRRLTKDGAHVVEVSPLKFDWIKPGNKRWEHVMDKLHVFELIQYEKVLLLDSDHVVVKPLDGIFQDPATDDTSNLGKVENIRDDEGVQPSTYVMAGNSGPREAPHPYPSERGRRLNAGFVVLKPSIKMYKHYLAVSSIEGRFPGTSPEQDLWNYVHSDKGNMPWKQINPDWTVNTPCYSDYEHGIASFHEKYWKCGRDLPLRDVLLRSRYKMEAFFQAHDQKS